MIRNFWLSTIFILACAGGCWWAFETYMLPTLAPVPDYVWKIIVVSFVSWTGWHFLHKISQ